MIANTVPPEWQDVADELRQVFVKGEKALRKHRFTLERVFRIGHAFAVMQQEAMRLSHANNPIGKHYDEALAALTHPTPKLAKVNKTDRAQYVWCFQQREQLEEWWGTVAKNKRDRWGHPDTIKKQYLKAHGGDGQGDGQPGMPKAAEGTGAKPDSREEVVGLQEELDTALADTPEGIARVWFDSPHKAKLLAAARALIDLDEASGQADGTVGVEVGDTLSGIVAGAAADGANNAPKNPAPDAVARRRVSAPNSTRNAALMLALPLAALAALTLVPPAGR
jgi:hypothetical protein